ncbi:MAG: rolling circle replication-associated protein, partial [Bacteroidota bacterium]
MSNLNDPDVISLSNPSILPESVYNFLKRGDLVLSIKGESIQIFKGKDSSYHANKRDPLADANLNKRKYTGSMSKETVKKISQKLNLWYEALTVYNQTKISNKRQHKRKLVLLTVTLPTRQQHTDKEIKRKIFVPFLDTLKYHYDLINYFWRAESQKNGNIHFHLIIDTYIDKKEIQKLWNAKCEKLLYVSEFEAKHLHRNPPTTKIEAIRRTGKSIKYLLKYATKEEEGREINGRIWGMNKELKSIKRFFFLEVEQIREEIFQLLAEKKVKIWENEHFIIITLKEAFIDCHRFIYLRQKYIDHLLKLYSYLYYQDDPFL